MNDWLPLVAIALLFVPSTVTVYPSGSRFAPVVVVLTLSVPVVGVLLPLRAMSPTLITPPFL